jgi:hypothetical protein
MMAWVPAWAWRWIALLTLLAGGAVTGYVKGRDVESQKFELYRQQEKQLALEQAAVVRGQNQAQLKLKEVADAEAEKLRVERDRAVVDANRVRDSLASRSIVPKQPGSPGGGSRVCYSREQLDRGLHESLAGLYKRVVELAEQGQRDRDIAITCSNYVRGLAAVK